MTGITYTPNGNLLSVTDSILGGTWTYGYDDFNRLASTTQTGSTNNVAFTYKYDRYGNRWQQNGGPGPTPQYSFDAKNHVTPLNCMSSTGFCYDGAGNVLQDTFHKYAFDAEGRILTVDTGTSGAATYVYDAMGHRVQRTKAGVVSYFGYDLAGRSIVEYQASAPVRFEGYAGGRHLVTYANNLTYFDFQDIVGTERVHMTQTGGSSESTYSLPFGDGQFTWGAVGLTGPTHFTGKERDSESNLDYFGARHESSTMGRFMSPDPKIPSLKQLVIPQKWNKYPYTINNPLKYFDPDGLEEMEVQFRAFIQQQSVGDPLGRRFVGDARGFSSAPSVSSRTTITVKIETDASKRPGNPIISVTPGSAGESRQVDANGNTVRQDTASKGLPMVTGMRDSNGDAVLNFTQNTKNPLEPESLTPGIRANLDVTVSQDGSSVEASGMLSATPSFELNVGDTNIPLQTEPSGAAFGLGLFLPLGIDVVTPLPPPPPPPPACSMDKENSCQ